MFLDSVDKHDVAKKLAPQGDIAKGVKTNKPKEGGLYAYVWRMVRFNSGIDVTIPVMAIFDLADYAKTLPNFTEDWSGALIPEDSQAKALVDEANSLADTITMMLGYDKYGAAKRWGRVL